MRAFALLLLLTGPRAGDVLVLKNGTKVAGRVVQKDEHYEVTTEFGLRTYLKEEVDRVLSGPRELLGDADGLVEAAKKDYEAALALPESQQQARFRDAVAKVTKAREIVAPVSDLFPDDAALAKKLSLIMQLMRLCRERLVSEVAGPASRGGSAPTGALRVDDALATLASLPKRSEPARRAAALSAFRAQRAGDAYDMATAAMLFLARPEAEWRLEGPGLAALQEYFDKGWLKEPAKLTPSAHLEAAAFLAARRPGAGAGGEALALFGLAHLSYAPPGPEAEKAARALGLTVDHGRFGTAEGHQVRDLNAWIAGGDFDLAVLAFKENRIADTPAVRYVWSYALLRLIVAKSRGFDRPAGALETVRAAEPSVQDHVGALVRSIRAVAVCNTCAGEAKLRCTNCHGKKEIKIVCAACKGKGKKVSALGAEVLCNPCKAKGITRVYTCEKCENGYTDCRQCDKPRSPPSLEDICEAAPCEACEGRGLAFRRVLYPCRACLGLGRKLTPRADPAKVLR
jgi:hypothetical protein